MSYHLRYTPYELGTDLTTFCDKYTTKYLIAHEQYSKLGLPVKPHFHVYFQSDFNMDTLRNHFTKLQSIPKTGRGSTNKWYCLKNWNDSLTYFVKQGNIIAYKGISDQEVAAACAAAKEVEDSFRSSLKGGKDPNPSGAPAPAKEKETEWIKILGSAIKYHKENGQKEVPYEKWVKLIRYWFLKECKPFPHPANTKRYAQSLDCLARSDWGENLEQLEKEAFSIPPPD